MPKIVLTVSNNGNGTLTIRRFRLVNTGGPVKGSEGLQKLLDGLPPCQPGGKGKPGRGLLRPAD
jgi:hypothetical protein